MVKSPSSLSCRGIWALPKIGCRAENAHVGKLAVILGVVEAVAHDEGIGDGEAHVVGADGAGAARGFVEQGHEPQALGPVRFEHAAQVMEGIASVEEVCDHQNVDSFKAHDDVIWCSDHGYRLV